MSTVRRRWKTIGYDAYLKDLLSLFMLTLDYVICPSIGDCSHILFLSIYYPVHDYSRFQRGLASFEDDGSRLINVASVFTSMFNDWLRSPDVWNYQEKVRHHFQKGNSFYGVIDDPKAVASDFRLHSIFLTINCDRNQKSVPRSRAWTAGTWSPHTNSISPATEKRVPSEHEHLQVCRMSESGRIIFHYIFFIAANTPTTGSWREYLEKLQHRLGYL